MKVSNRSDLGSCVLYWCRDACIQVAQKLLDIDVANATCGRIEDSHALTALIQGAAAAQQEAAREVAKAADELAKVTTESENVEAHVEALASLKRAQEEEESYRVAQDKEQCKTAVGFDQVMLMLRFRCCLT